MDMKVAPAGEWIPICRDCNSHTLPHKIIPFTLKGFAKLLRSLSGDDLEILIHAAGPASMFITSRIITSLSFGDDSATSRASAANPTSLMTGSPRRTRLTFRTSSDAFPGNYRRPRRV